MQKFLNTDKLFSMTPWKRKNVNVFLLLECADEDSPVIQALVKWPRHEAIPLFVGTKDEENADIGPHLVKVDRDSQLLQWFLEEGAEHGIIFFSEASAEVLGAHLQPFLECILPDDRRKMFRFYDPVTFYYFIPNLTPEELRRFMGPACGVACTRPVCAEEGDSLFVEHLAVLEDAPARQWLPWALSGESFAGFTIPTEYSLALALTDFFYDTRRHAARLIRKEHVTRFSRKIVEQNRIFGLRSQSDIMDYLDLVSKIGTGYQNDPLFRRIAKAVQPAPTPEEAPQTLFTEADELYAKARGDDDEWFHAALQRVLNTSYDAWYRPNFPSEAAAMLTTLYPERAEYAGGQAVIDLAQIARKEAEKWALPPRPGICLLTGLMFFLGVDCVTDPLHSWIAQKLHEDTSPATKTRMLFEMGRRLAKIELRPRSA
jgi:hypothetical protein